MNGPDLKFLAERTSALEDRTNDRLAEVHGLIESRRRRRRAAAAAGVAGLVVAVVVGLAFLDNGTGRSSPSPAPHPTPTPAPDGAGSAPKRGTCWAVPPDVNYDDHDNWFDDSPRVPCNEPHTTETAGFVVLPEATVAEAESFADDCFEIVRGYVGVNQNSWIPWAAVTFLPTREQVADGASWARCDAVFPESWSDPFPGARTVTRSVELVADDPPLEFQACFDQSPDADQPFVPCDQPHLYEQTGTMALARAEQEYPSAATRAAEAQRQCPAGVPEGVAGVLVTAAWDLPEYFTAGQPLSGPCFFFRTDGTPLPGR
jgi:Septum formation